MKKWAVVCVLFFLLGCANEQLKTMATDTDYARRQEKLDVLEKSYLDGSLNYADYMKKKEELEGDYTKEIQKREAIIHGQKD